MNGYKETRTPQNGKKIVFAAKQSLTSTVEITDNVLLSWCKIPKIFAIFPDTMQSLLQLARESIRSGCSSCRKQQPKISENYQTIINSAKKQFALCSSDAAESIKKIKNIGSYHVVYTDDYGQRKEVTR